jgi:Zn finger protein HypA/HybF involved in hydrogenase expression
MVKAKSITGLHESLAKCHPSIERGIVWCKTCGGSQKVDPAQCFAYGWPMCHGQTMTLDHPSTCRSV